jgi:hypothetical protein
LPSREDLILSASVDKCLKLWEISPENDDEPYQLLSSVQLNESIERFVIVRRDDRLILLVANGNLMSLVEVNDENKLIVL